VFWRQRVLREGMLAGQRCAIARYLGEAIALFTGSAAVMVRLLTSSMEFRNCHHHLLPHIRLKGIWVDQLSIQREAPGAILLIVWPHLAREESRNGHSRINQEHLAQMVGTTSVAGAHFMNKFGRWAFRLTGSGAFEVIHGLWA